jgi:hypothetical protein
MTAGAITSAAGDLDIPRDFKPVYSVAKVDHVDYGQVKRVAVTIRVPPGLIKDQVANNIRHVAVAQGNGMHAIMVFVCEDGDAVDQGYTVAKADYAPGGDWARAAEGLHDNSRKSYQLAIQYRNGYFSADRKTAGAEQGLSRVQVNKLCAELDAAAIEADNKAYAMYPITDGCDIKAVATRQKAAREKLQAAATAKVAAKYGVTPAQADELWSDYIQEKCQ